MGAVHISQLSTHPAVVNILNLGARDLNILALVLSDRLAALGGDGVLLSGAVWGVIEEVVTEQRDLRLRGREGLGGPGQYEETEERVHGDGVLPR